MGWTGIFLGAMVGFGLTRSTWGALIGAIIGYMIQQGSRAVPHAAAGPQELRAFTLQGKPLGPGELLARDGRDSPGRVVG